MWNCYGLVEYTVTVAIVAYRLIDERFGGSTFLPQEVILTNLIGPN